MPNKLLLRLKPSKVYWLPFFIGQILGILVICTVLGLTSVDFGNTNILNRTVLLAIPVAGMLWLFLKATIKTDVVNLFSILLGSILFISWLIRNDGVYELATILFIKSHTLENALALMGLVLVMTAAFDLSYFSQNLMAYTLIALGLYQVEPLLIKVNGYTHSKFHVFFSGAFLVILSLFSAVFIEFVILISHEIKHQRHSRKI